MRRELVCLRPSSPAALEVRQVPVPRPGRGEVLVRVEASSVNPIDAKRAGGYGQRLLSLKGAGQFPLVLGNDVAGCVEALGPDTSAFGVGERVYGLVGTGRNGGAHASHVVVPQSLLRRAPPGVAPETLAVLPYCFTTMWLAVQGAGLVRANADGKKVLVLGAAGALGRLSLQLLSSWGCRITAICATGTSSECLALGASTAIDRGPQAISALPAEFDVVLNFASWEEELTLASKLSPSALGQSTTVHPLLGHFDRLGWLKGALACRRDKLQANTAVRQRAHDARYSWTVFRPDQDALTELAAYETAKRLLLPIGICASFSQADRVFARVCAGQPGRAVLTP